MAELEINCLSTSSSLICSTETEYMQFPGSQNYGTKKRVIMLLIGFNQD